MDFNLGGSYNTALGSDALNRNTSGTYNTALGYEAGVTTNTLNANTTGITNTYVGAYSGPGTSTQLTNSTAIGYAAVVTANHALVLGSVSGVNGASSTVNVGIGKTAPDQRLHIDGGVRLDTATAKPACSASTRGTFWVTQGASGVKDSVEVCTKDAANAYAWRLIW